MTLPATITQEDQDRIDARIESKEQQIAQATDDIASINDQISSTESEEATNKKMWDYYHSDIITAYESEKRYLMGDYISNPIVEQDLIDRSNNIGRLYDPSQSVPDIIRIAEFDGGGLVHSSTNELATLSSYDDPLAKLTTGLTTSTSGISTTTLEAIPDCSVGQTYVVEVTSLANITPDIEVLIYDGTRSCIAMVDSTTSSGECSLPAYTNQLSCESHLGIWTNTYTIGLTILTPHGGIGSGAQVLGIWTGFTPAERSAKIATTPASSMQTIMDYYLSVLDNCLSGHISLLESQKSAYLTNLDPELDISYLSSLNTAISSYSVYQSSLDISDGSGGVGYLTGLNSSRLSVVNNRISAVGSACSNYYDSRFSWAVERCGFMGTMTSIVGLNNNINTIQDQNDRNQESIDLYSAEFNG